MAWADVIKRRSLLTEKPKKPKNQSSGRVWKIENARSAVADNLKKWVENDLANKGSTGKIFTVIGANETKISLHYLTTLIGGKSFYITTTDKDEVKKCCLELADDIVSGEADEEINRIYAAAKAKRSKK
jgi:hypothetical protein